MRIALVTLLVAVCGVRPATACTKAYVDLFSWYEQAAAVGVARAKAVVENKPVTVKLERTLRGQPPRQLEVVPDRMCGPTFQPNERFIALFHEDGTLAEKLPASNAVVQAIVQWRATKPGKPRIALLARLAKSKDEALALAASTRRGIEERALLKADHQRQ